MHRVENSDEIEGLMSEGFKESKVKKGGAGLGVPGVCGRSEGGPRASLGPGA